ncbi:MAG: hypothetical protein IM571_01090 [Chitinophagaceae bacterium]|jgi:hypothetical protein|nr:hypothetical protein [Chitinophagaceae bacterium]MCA6470410.1 hypothetical protein [Chitinophagaceae bacterium]MCA6476520.1 hypothetical protein [Chitinophagaceae bacterium]MCA6493500.1 hypothetical protein [Chitinophagaceae bacterium]MCA6498017.1 hypothetical protein [Chitinophagaceae bacterium]
MEVHHPHHLAHKKNWKEYFLEFLMLFLAVFLGFLAENVRETYIERHREKEYISGLIQNLRSDTADITKVLERNQVKQEAWTALLQLADKDLSKHVYDTIFYEKFVKGAFVPIFRPNDATIVQLKSSGNLRLVNKQDVTDSILSYDKIREKLVGHNDYLVKGNDEVWEKAYPIFKAWIFADTSYMDLNTRTLIRFDVPPLRVDPLQQQLFFGQLGRMMLILRANRDYMNQQKDKATTLIQFLEKRYNL